MVGDVDLEGRHAGQGAGRGPDLGREVGKVARSLPNMAELTSVNWSPVSCIPSPESPAKRMTTRS